MRSGQGSIDVIRQLVELYFKHEAWESATRWAEEVLKISPEMVSLRVNAIEAYRKQKDWTAVRLHAVEGVRRYPEKFVFSYYLGMVENNLGHAEKALKYLEMCYKKTPKDSRIGYEYARALVDTHQYEKAKRVINTVDQSQLAIPALVVIASICTRIGDFQKSITLHREILAKEPDNPDMHWSLANALLKAGMPGEGWDEYEWGFKANQRNLSGRLTCHFGMVRNLPKIRSYWFGMSRGWATKSCLLPALQISILQTVILYFNVENV